MIHLNKQEQALIDEVLQEFNFEKCKRVMDYLNWEWAFTNSVPTIEELKEASKKRIDSAILSIKESKESYRYSCSCSSGGLQATVYKNRYNRIVNITLEFVITDWSTS